MNSLEQAIADVMLALNDLCGRVKVVQPGVLCQVGEMSRRIPPQVYASFLAHESADSLDLCIYFLKAGAKLTISGDLVRGGSGEVLTEFSEEVPVGATGNGTAHWDITAACSYICEQEETILVLLQSLSRT